MGRWILIYVRFSHAASHDPKSHRLMLDPGVNPYLLSSMPLFPATNQLGYLSLPKHLLHE
jgi:hypothetical protein